MKTYFRSQERFQNLEKPHFFIRVDDVHPLDLMIGINAKGQKTIQFSGTFGIKRIKGTSSLEVTQFSTGSISKIRFSLTEDTAKDLFYKFCDDLVESSRDVGDSNGGYIFLVNRFLKWKKMFVVKNQLLTEQQIMGLIGELLFLHEKAIPKFGISKAIAGWSGAEKTHKDFSYDEGWFEIKTILTSASSIKISSIEQLESSINGFLVVHVIEKMSDAFEGITLNKLVLCIRSLITNIDDFDLFYSKLDNYGYLYTDEYDVFSYEYKKTQYYVVDENFPRIDRSKIDQRIIKVSYDISLNGIEEYFGEVF